MDPEPAPNLPECARNFGTGLKIVDLSDRNFWCKRTLASCRAAKAASRPTPQIGQRMRVALVDARLHLAQCRARRRGPCGTTPNLDLDAQSVNIYCTRGTKAVVSSMRVVRNRVQENLSTRTCLGHFVPCRMPSRASSASLKPKNMNARSARGC